MAYFTKVRLYYLDAKKKRQTAFANTVIFDIPDAAADDAISRDYIRPATEGEIAEARALMPKVSEKKPAKKSAEKADTGDDTQAGGADGDDTTTGGTRDDGLA